MAEPSAFLSCTRKDDHFFGGYITAFRQALEAGVQVVTGDRLLRLCQDVEGIVIGEQWGEEARRGDRPGEHLLADVDTPVLRAAASAPRDGGRLFHERRAFARTRRHDPADLLGRLAHSGAGRGAGPRSGGERRSPSGDGTTCARTAGCPWSEPAARQRRSGPSQGDRDCARTASVRRVGADVAGSGGGSRQASGSPLSAAPRSWRSPASATVLWVDDRARDNVVERAALEPYGSRFARAGRPARLERCRRAASSTRHRARAGLTIEAAQRLRSCTRPVPPRTLIAACGCGRNRGVRARRAGRGATASATDSSPATWITCTSLIPGSAPGAARIDLIQPPDRSAATVLVRQRRACAIDRLRLGLAGQQKRRDRRRHPGARSRRSGSSSIAPARSAWSPTRPSASAPAAIARRASPSDWMQQILIRMRCMSDPSARVAAGIMAAGQS